MEPDISQSSPETHGRSAPNQDMRHEPQDDAAQNLPGPQQLAPANSGESDILDQVTSPTLEQRITVRGAGLGNTYVRVRRPYTDAFTPHGDGALEATEQVLAPATAAGQAYQRVKRALLGRRLATEMQAHERLTKVKALAVLSSDAISSVAYGTEASLAILITAGLGVLHFNLVIGASIILLMIIVATSYRQTIHAYPHGGGSYIVARDNLGDWPGLVAAAALLIDYVLTVSVSVAAGVDALVSAISVLAPFTVALGVGCIVLIVLGNLRGIRESGTIFAAPTYLFVVCFFIMILVGVISAAHSPGGLLGAAPPQGTPENHGWTQHNSFGLLLLLTTFASGCVAMTGVEAISNGVPAFKAPESHNAARTLMWMVGILVTFYAGTTYLAWRFGILPYADQHITIDAQIGLLLFRGPFTWFFYLVQGATLLILVLAANTSFADFPRLSSILARDGYLPHLFALRGDRLAFTVGILVLGALSTALLIVFHGNTEALINLYALGVFVAFTLSQSGMVVRWYRKREAAGPGWRRALVINLVGAIATGVVALIIGVSKFDRGAWIVVLLVPLLIAMFYGISRHYAHVERATVALTPLDADELRHRIIVPIVAVDQPALQSLAYARSITPFVTVVHVAKDAVDAARVRAMWTQWAKSQQGAWARAAQAWRASAGQANAARTGQKRDQGDATETVEKMESASATETAIRWGPQLVLLEPPHRSVVASLVAYMDTSLDAVRDDKPGATITVVLPEAAPVHWWEGGVFHSLRALRLKLALYARPGVVVANVPLFRRAGGTYTQGAAHISAKSTMSAQRALRPEELRHIVIVPIAKLNAPALQSLAYARSIAPVVTAVHVATDKDEEAALLAAWAQWAESQQGIWAQAAEQWRGRTLLQYDRGAQQQAETAIRRGPQLVVVESPFRSLLTPLVTYIDALRDGNPGATVTVVLSEFVPAHWWEHLLHNQTALRLKLALYTRPDTVVADVPYHLATQKDLRA
jgi:amino acid transporter